jgi:hypothetical protein
MRRPLLLALAVISIAALLSAAASAHQKPHFTGCPRHINGTKQDPEFFINGIAVRDISCGTAYNDIKNFPEELHSGSRYRGYICTYKPYGENGSRVLCTRGARAYRFIGEGA